MLVAYWIATLMGGTLLVSSVAFGHHGGSHGHGDIGHSGSSFGLGALGGMVLSLRFWTYLFAIGGGCGLLLRLLGNESEPKALLLSLGVGLVSGAAASIVMSRIGSQAGGVLKNRELVYRLGTMLLPASPGKSSQVRVSINNQMVDLIAVTDDSAIAAREEVLILDIKDGIAHVTRNKSVEENR